MFNTLTTLGMITFIVMGLPWIQLASTGEGFKVVGHVLSRIYLENYPKETLI